MERYKEIERSIIKKYRKDIWAKFVKAVKDYKLIEEKDANSHKPTVVFLDSDNNPCEEKECKRTVGK